MVIKQYENKRNGKKYYMFSIYLGLDPITGKERRTTKRGFKTKKDAEMCYHKIMATSSKGITTNAEITLKDIGGIWLEYYKNDIKNSSFYLMSYYYNNLVEEYGETKIKELKYTKLQDILNNINGTSKVKMYSIIFKKILDFCVLRELIPSNPMQFVKIKKTYNLGKKEEDKFYTKEELKKFFCCLNNSLDIVVFRLLAYTGMRKGELCALTWEDINFKDNTIFINKTLYNGKIQSTKTKSSIRTITIDDTTMKILKDYKKTTNGEGYIFDISTIYYTISNKLNYICEKYKLKKISVHGFRHTHCSLLLQSGATLQEVQKRLGHSDLKTTLKIYTHITMRQHKNIIKNFSEYVDI